ncbi:hypothetical protein [Armatimonas sp.]|uniref:hypothetical protein n=1 Tax=Armatimonas sp. TaxID=1872638 RepID=UPI00374DD23D
MGQQQNQHQLPEDKVPLVVEYLWLYLILTIGLLIAYSNQLFKSLPLTNWSLLFLLGNLMIYASWIALGWWARATTSLPLTDEHPMAESAGTFAARTGKRIKRLRVFPSPKIDAYYTPAGSLYLSSALLRHLTPREAEAIIAHNIHLGSVKWVLLIPSMSFAILGFFSSSLQNWLQSRFGLPFLKAAYIVEFGRFAILIISVWLGYTWNNRRAKAADAFAVKVTGDPDRVVQAILKAYFFSPGITQGSMEIPPNHLRERIWRIRENAPASER